MKKRENKRSLLTLSLDESIRHDLLFFNNPILMQGLALTPAVGATTTLNNALMFSAMLLMLIVPVRVIGDLLFRILPSRLRVAVYAILAAVVYIPASYAVYLLFGAQVQLLGIFLPLLAVDGIVIARAEIPTREGAGAALRNGLLTALGAALALIPIGAVRELLGEGCIYGVRLLEKAPMTVASTIAGGFITVALFSALLQAAANRYKRARMSGGGAE